MIKLSVSIDVPDLAKGVAFYGQALGCEKVRDQGDDMVVLSADNAEIYLLKREADSAPLFNSDVKRRYDRHWTPVHLDFLCDDVENMVNVIKQFGGQYEGGESGEWGSIAYCSDPFGNGFCIINE